MPDPAPEACPDGFDPIWRQLTDLQLGHRGEALWVKDEREGRYRLVLGASRELLGLSPEQVLGRTDAELFGQDVARVLRAADQAATAHGGPMSAEHVIDLAGHRRTLLALRVAFSLGGSPRVGCFWSDPEPQRQLQQRLAAALQQIEQQQFAHRQLRRELSDQLARDLQSGLQTRGHFEEQLRRELDLSQREQRDFAAVLLEVDPPPQPGAHWNAEMLEFVLEAVGRVLKGGTRAMDACCRLEDGRFAVLLSGVGLATAHSRTEALRRQCATQIVVARGGEVRFSVSAGVASFPHTAADGDALLEACEAALRRARHRGGNQVALASVRFGPA